MNETEERPEGLPRRLSLAGPALPAAIFAFVILETILVGARSPSAGMLLLAQGLLITAVVSFCVLRWEPRAGTMPGNGEAAARRVLIPRGPPPERLKRYV